MDFQAINQRAISCLPDLLPSKLPGGRVKGREFVCGDLAGNPGESLAINLDSGKWSDFATDDKGGDIISLVAAVHGSSQVDAARYLTDWMGTTTRTTTRKASTIDTWKPTPTATPPKSIIHPKMGKPTATFEYRDPDEKIIGYDCRFDPPVSGPKKQVLPFTPCINTATGKTDFRWKSPTTPRPLYGLDRLSQRPDAPVLFCEGCKATDAAQRQLSSVVAVTWQGGSGAVDKADLAPIAGRRVGIWPDNDEPGRKAAETLAQRCLEAGAAEVFIIEPPPGKKDGWDAADAEAEGWTPDQASEWIRKNKRLVVAARELAGVAPKTTGEEWPEPEPLPDELLPVETFVYDLLPDSLHAWVKDICERVQCPSDFVAVGVMVALAAVIGRKIGMGPQKYTDWIETPNIWGLIIGRPGILKSPALEAALAPLKRLVANALNLYKEAFKEFAKESKIGKLRSEEGEKKARDAIKKDSTADVSNLLMTNEAEEPTLHRYMTNDSSPAALGELLRHNQNGVLVYRDELVSLIKGLDREENAEGRGFYLTGWNGNSPYTFDRIGRGMNLHIDAVCLSVLGGTQPGKIGTYIGHAVKGGESDDGLIQRFSLMVWPDNPNDWRNVDRWPDNDAKNEAFKVFDYLDKLNPLDIGAIQDTEIDGQPDGIPYLRFNDEALELFNEWRQTLEIRIRDDSLPPYLESHYSKYRKLIPALSLLIHLCEGGHGAVTEGPTLKALAWGEYLESHARRIYHAGANNEVGTAKAILKKVKDGSLKDGFRGWDVWRPNWSMLTDREKVNTGLIMLVDYGYLRAKIDKETGGRNSTSYQINPWCLP